MVPVHDQTAPSVREMAEQSPAYLRHSELLYSMHELSRLISTYFDQAMAEHDLTHAQWWGLMHIFENEGATQSELATIMQMGRASTGKLIDRLKEKGWAEQRPDANDNRVRRIYLRPAVIPVFTAMQKEGARLFTEFLQDISADEENAMIAGLRKIKANAAKRTRT